MATAAISDFKSALTYGGARPALFDFYLYAPTGMLDVSALYNTHFYCNVSAIPPLTVTPIEKQYFGRTVKIPGDIVYGDLTTTVMNAEDYSVRNAIETWMDHINSHVDNVTSDNFADADFRSTIWLTQYDKAGNDVQTYKFFDAWPMTLTEIALSHDTASDIEQYDVTWAYNYYSHTSDEYEWDLT